MQALKVLDVGENRMPVKLLERIARAIGLCDYLTEVDLSGSAFSMSGECVLCPCRHAATFVMYSAVQLQRAPI